MTNVKFVLILSTVLKFLLILKEFIQFNFKEIEVTVIILCNGECIFYNPENKF